MNAPSSDEIIRRLTALPTRRALAHAALRIALILGVAQRPIGAEARKRRKKRKNKKKKKVAFNDFGCVDVGKFCQNSDQCCSGICEGKKDKRKCQAHDTGGCLAGQQEEVCGGGGDIPCTTSTGDPDGVCNTTTGNAGYCTNDADCFPCTKDADCVEFCGPAAACLVCAEFCTETGGTGCAGPEADSCDFP